GPAGLLENLPVERPQRGLARIYAATRQLELRLRFRLMRQEHVAPMHQQGIDTVPYPVALPPYQRLPEPSDHGAPSWPPGCRPHIHAVWQGASAEETPMTSLSMIAWDDTVLPFQLDRSDIRGRVARLDGVLDRVLSQHNYPMVVEALVAEAALLTALIGQTIKLRWKLSLQIRGDGPVRIIATDYYAPAENGGSARMRAWASFDTERLDPAAPGFSQIGSGYLAVLLDQGPGTTPYQGITPLAGGSLSACAETYFAQSEQLPTRFALSFGKSRLPGGAERWRAGGIMLQHMPKASPFVAKEGGSGEGGLLAPADILDGPEGETWARSNLLRDTVEELELIGPSVTPTDLLVRLF